MSEMCLLLGGYDLLLRFVFGAFNRKYLMVLFLEALAALSCDSFVYVRVVCVCVYAGVCVCAVECCIVFGIFISSAENDLEFVQMKLKSYKVTTWPKLVSE